MIADDLKKHAADLETLVEGLTARQLDPVIGRLCADERWELMGIALITAAEPPARRLINCLLEHQQFASLVPAACLRRQLRQPMRAVTVGTRAFRDWDAEDSTEGVPDFIQAEAEEIAAGASARRETATLQAAGVDRDAVREYIVTKLAEQLVQQPEAGEALVKITQASAWEETRRLAAMKLVNHRTTLGRLAGAQRTADLIAVARATGLEAARNKVAAQMAAHLDTYVSEQDRAALEFLAQNHPEAAGREQAAAALSRLPS